MFTPRSLSSASSVDLPAYSVSEMPPASRCTSPTAASPLGGKHLDPDRRRRAAQVRDQIVERAAAPFHQVRIGGAVTGGLRRPQRAPTNRAHEPGCPLGGLKTQLTVPADDLHSDASRPLRRTLVRRAVRLLVTMNRGRHSSPYPFRLSIGPAVVGRAVHPARARIASRTRRPRRLTNPPMPGALSLMVPVSGATNPAPASVPKLMSIGELPEQETVSAGADPSNSTPCRIRRRHMAKHGSKVGVPPQHFARSVPRRAAPDSASIRLARSPTQGCGSPAHKGGRPCDRERGAIV